MDFKVIWSEEAIEDLESIAFYIARDSKYYASSVVSKILSTTRLLETFPLVGRVVPEIENKNIREHFVYSYRVIYEIKRKYVTILAIAHGKRLFSSYSDRFE